jgi:hypothetical protein
MIKKFKRKTEQKAEEKGKPANDSQKSTGKKERKVSSQHVAFPAYLYHCIIVERIAIQRWSGT